MKRSTVRAALAVACVVVVSACGGGDGDDDGPLTRAEYIEKANAICADAQDEIDALGPLPLGDPAKTKEWVSKNIEILEEEIKDVRELEMPPDDKATLDAIFADADVLLAESAKLKNETDTGKLFAAANALVPKQKALNEKLIAYGLTVCGEVDEASATPTASPGGEYGG